MTRAASSLRVEPLTAEAFAPFGGIPSRWEIAAVAIPLMVIAGVATHFNSRASVARQSEQAAANPQSAIMNKLALYVFPLGVLVGGPFLPIAILIYWVSNNIWTYAQQHLVFRKIDQEEAEKKAAVVARRNENAPKPGARPDRAKKKNATAVNPDTPENPATSGGDGNNLSLEKPDASDEPAKPSSGSGTSARKNQGGSKNSKRKRR